jgi:hypothetical protein
VAIGASTLDLELHPPPSYVGLATQSAHVTQNSGVGPDDAAVKALGLASGGKHPGALFHWAAQTDAGVKVVDVWASKEELQRFVEEQVAPAGREAGLPDPELTFIDVHAYMVGR